MATVRTIEDPADPRLADYVNLTDVGLRRQLEPAGGLFIAEGDRVVRRAMAAGYRLRSVLLEKRWLPGLADVLDPVDVPVFVVDDRLMRSVTGYPVHRGALAAVHRRELPTPGQVLAGADRVVVLEGVVEPANVGSVFRAGAALGMDAVLLDPRCADPLYRRAVKVSMGAVFTLRYARLSRWPADLDAVRDAGLTLLALTPALDAVDLDELAVRTRRYAVLLGTEGEGLTPRAQAAADVRIRIPMAHDVDSLNVAAAAAVAFYALNRRQPSGRDR
jgi:tRNA G18 (ribose-2'-O)-methylase SpoU